jgi:hypothetical protein
MYLRRRIGLAVAALSFAACSRHPTPSRASFVPLADLQSIYGHLITGGNHPTPDQNGTGDRLGLFLDANQTVWGLPLTTAPDGSVLACAPPGLQNAAVTDTYPATATIIGATNAPTGWRGGTGKLELLLRSAQGTIEWRSINGAHLTSGSVCWAQELPGPPQQLEYYRLAPA